MMETLAGLSPGTIEHIQSARSVQGVPVSEPMVPYRNIGDLLERQTDRLEQKCFLVFYSDDGQRLELSYREFLEQVCQTAAYLQSMGITHGDRIAVMSFNHADVVVQYFAAFLLGAVVVPINAGEDDRRVLFTVKDSGARLAFARDVFVDRLLGMHDQLPGLEYIVEAGNRTHPSLPHFDSEIKRQQPVFQPAHAPALDSEALIVYTSGTTGNPKGVLLDQYDLLVDAMAIAEWHQLAEDQRVMCVLPLHHVNGIVVTLMTPLYAGGTIVLNQRFHPDKFFERISAEKVAVVSVVPTLLQFLLHADLNMAAYKLARLRHFICGAGPLTVELASKFEQTFKIPIIHGYGLSESTCYSCFLPIDLTVAEHKAWIGRFGFPSIGVPLPVNEMAIHDAQGNELPEGEKGEIVIRGHNVMARYFQNPEVNDATFAFGWFRSGDEGFFRYDDTGRQFFFITGRIKELIIRGGANISPFEIDEILMNMPGVLAGIAVGFENDWYGEEVGAFVKVKEGMELTEQQVLNYCRRHLPFSKSPKVVVFGETVPVTSTGKYQRTLCKDLFGRWKTVQFSENLAGQ
jgi:acyl-CoA synthetase (AMP-forming)/AMP-acid ligase II